MVNQKLAKHLGCQKGFAYDHFDEQQGLAVMTEIYDFDQIIDRSNTSSSKWAKYSGRDILPMWVADTDFAVAPCIQQAVIERAGHPIYGYTDPPQPLIEIIVERMRRLYGWEIDPRWLLFLPGVVGAMNCACRGIGKPGDPVYTAALIYPNISQAPGLSSRVNQPIPMTWQQGRMVIDLGWLERQSPLAGQLMLLCNPQNPGGAIYRRSELQRLADFAEQHQMVICSDEIHCELVLDEENQHIPIASLNPQIEQRSITLMAPSKTFNLAGMGFSFAIVPNPELRAGMLKARKGIVPYVGAMGYAAAQAAYESGDEWRRQLCAYLAGNRNYLLDTINAIEGLQAAPVEATYLAWIDVSELGLDNPPQFFEAAGVGMSTGAEFGDSSGMRFNFGCPRSRVAEAVERIRKAVEGIT
jgi:cystathionine beta-lyase